MGLLEKIARAENSRNLKHCTWDCDVDVLGAVGMAASACGGALALYRLKYLGDLSCCEEASVQFGKWASRALLRRIGDKKGSRKIAEKTLAYWLHDVCDECKGKKYIVITGTPFLSDKSCPACKGDGRRALKADRKDQLDTMRELLDRADDAVENIKRLVNLKLYDK